MSPSSLKISFCAIILLLTSFGFVQSAGSAYAASGLDYRGTVTIEAYHSVEDVAWKVDGIEYVIGQPFYFSVTTDGFVLADGGYIATDGTISKAGLAELRKTKQFTSAFKAALRRYLINNEGYQAGSDQLNQALKTAVMSGRPKFTHYAVTGVGVGEQREDLKEVAVGSNTKEHGYPAIFQLKGLKIPAYQVVAGVRFNSQNLWPLSSRFKGAEAKPIERQTDKYGNDMYPYFQVLMADDLVPGTQVVSKGTPRQIRGMIGAGDYKWSDGADALYPMNTWIDLARSNGIAINVVGEPIVRPSPSATAASPPVSPTQSAPTPPAPAPSVAVPTSHGEPPAEQPVADEGWPGWIFWIAIAMYFIGLTVLMIFAVIINRRRKSAQAASEQLPPQDEASEE